MQNKNRRYSSKLGGEDHVLVYSTDPKPDLACADCNQTKSKCKCSVDNSIVSASIKPLIQIEKKGRGGKVVTLVKRLPVKENFLADLCAHLKRRLGCGGTFYTQETEGVIEIQGDRRKDLSDLINTYLNK